jgi:hypothetical protein
VKQVATKTLRKKDGMTVDQRKERLNQILAEMEVQKQVAKDATEERKRLQEEGLTHMRRLKIKKFPFVDADGRKRNGTFVQGTSLVYDEARLKKRLGSKIWPRLLTKVLDQNKLKAFVASGEITAEVLAECSEEVENAPYIKVT